MIGERARYHSLLLAPAGWTAINPRSSLYIKSSTQAEAIPTDHRKRGGCFWLSMPRTGNSVRVALLATSVLIGRAFAQSCSELVHLSRRLVIGTRGNGPRNPAWTI